MYLVSILVPVYGVEKYIERCARSLFEQTYESLEYIFVDDCSPDDSIAILKRVMEDYPERKDQVRIIQHDHNRGLAAARNTALDAATSPFISHVDSDDYLSLDAIQLLVNKQVETDADIVLGNFRIITNRGVQKLHVIDYNDKHSMLSKVFDIKEAAHRLAISGWKNILHLSATYQNKNIFDLAKNNILANYSDCFDEIGWNNPINRIFRCNFTLHSHYRRLYAYIKRFVVSVRG